MRVQSRSIRVVEYRRGDRDRNGAAGHRHVQGLAHPPRSAGNQRQSDGAAQCRAPIRRRNVPEGARDGGRNDLRPLLQHDGRIVGQQSHELLAVVPQHVRPHQRPLADEIVLPAANQPAQPEVMRNNRAVGLLADDDVAFFGTQHVHRLGAIGCRIPGRHQRVPDRRRVFGGNVDLEPRLPGEADTEQPGGDARDQPLPNAHVRHGRKVHVREGCQDCPRAGTLQGDHRPMLGRGREPGAELRKLGLKVVFHHVEHRRGAARGGGDVEAVRGKAGDHAVIAQEPILPQEQPVAAAPRHQRGEIIGVDPVEEIGRVRAGDLNFSQRAGIEDPGPPAHRQAFPRHGLVHGFLSPGEVAGALPGAGILEHRTICHRPFVQRCMPDRIE